LPAYFNGGGTDFCRDIAYNRRGVVYVYDWRMSLERGFGRSSGVRSFIFRSDYHEVGCTGSEILKYHSVIFCIVAIGNTCGGRTGGIDTSRCTPEDSAIRLLICKPSDSGGGGGWSDRKVVEISREQEGDELTIYWNDWKIGDIEWSGKKLGQLKK